MTVDDLVELPGVPLDDELRAIQVVNDTAALITSNLDLQRLVQTVVEIAVDLTKADFGAFFYTIGDEQGPALSLYALAGADPAAFSRLPHPRSTGLFAPTFSGESTVRSDDVLSDPRYGRAAPYHGMPPGHLPVRSYLAAPVVTRSGQVVGSLLFGHSEPGRFLEWHERVIVGIARHAAVAIDNSRLYEAAKEEILRRQDAEARLKEAELRLNAVLDNASVAIFLMNDVQHCIYMNAAAERLTGYTLAETQGRPLHDVIHHTRPDGSPFPLEDCAIDRAFPENANTRGEETFVHKDGRFYPVAFTASPVRDDDAKVVGTIIEVRDITEERRAREARDLLMREVDHRSRNVLAIVTSLVQLTRADTIADYKSILLGRISALARAQTSLASRRWEDGRLGDVVRDEVEALCPREQVSLDGPVVLLAPDQVQPMSMLLHELATNATKYGACSTPNGRLSIRWTLDGDSVTLLWVESGGPPVQEPAREGFGTRLILSLVSQLKGEVVRRWRPDGLTAEVSFRTRPALGAAHPEP